MTNSFIAIKGNYLDNSAKIFEAFNYVDTGHDKQFDNWDAFTAYLDDSYEKLADDEKTVKGLWLTNNWTVINDPETVDFADEEALLALSANLATDVITFLIQTTSNSFGFTVYSNNIIKRNFFVSDGQITDNIFGPLPEEAGLNINENIFVDDILGLANNLGIDLEGKTANTYVVKQFGYNDELKAELREYKEQHQRAENKKPWWKIW